VAFGAAPLRGASGRLAARTPGSRPGLGSRAAPRRVWGAAVAAALAGRRARSRGRRPPQSRITRAGAPERTFARGGEGCAGGAAPLPGRTHDAVCANPGLAPGAMALRRSAARARSCRGPGRVARPVASRARSCRAPARGGEGCAGGAAPLPGRTRDAVCANPGLAPGAMALRRSAARARSCRGARSCRAPGRVAGAVVSRARSRRGRGRAARPVASRARSCRGARSRRGRGRAARLLVPRACS